MDSITPDVAEQLLARYNKQLSQKLGVIIPQSPRELGNGERGTAYDIGGKVLKLTGDPDEAKAASKLASNRVDFAVHVEKVLFFKKFGFYAILQELLQPLPTNLRASFKFAITKLGFAEKLSDGGYANFVSELKKELQELKDQGESTELVK